MSSWNGVCGSFKLPVVLADVISSVVFLLQIVEKRSRMDFIVGAPTTKSIRERFSTIFMMWLSSKMSFQSQWLKTGVIFQASFISTHVRWRVTHTSWHTLLIDDQSLHWIQTSFTFFTTHLGAAEVLLSNWFPVDIHSVIVEPQLKVVLCFRCWRSRIWGKTDQRPPCSCLRYCVRCLRYGVWVWVNILMFASTLRTYFPITVGKTAGQYSLYVTNRISIVFVLYSANLLSHIPDVNQVTRLRTYG